MLVATATVPVPIVRSVCEYGPLEVVGVVGVLLLHAATDSSRESTSNRPGTVIIVLIY